MCLPRTHTRTHAHAHARTHARTQSIYLHQFQRCCVPSTHTHTCMHAHTHTRTHAHTQSIYLHQFQRCCVPSTHARTHAKHLPPSIPALLCAFHARTHARTHAHKVFTSINSSVAVCLLHTALCAFILHRRPQSSACCCCSGCRCSLTLHFFPQTKHSMFFVKHSVPMCLSRSCLTPAAATLRLLLHWPLLTNS